MSLTMALPSQSVFLHIVKSSWALWHSFLHCLTKTSTWDVIEMRKIKVSEYFQPQDKSGRLSLGRKVTAPLNTSRLLIWIFKMDVKDGRKNSKTNPSFASPLRLQRPLGGCHSQGNFLHGTSIYSFARRHDVSFGFIRLSKSVLLERYLTESGCKITP